MPDLDELFRTSIELEPHDDAPAGGDAPVAEQAVTADAATVDADDVLSDVLSLVSEWNAEHAPSAAAGRPGDDPAESDHAPRSRLLTAREVLAERIGSHPAAVVEPPVPASSDEAPDDAPMVDPTPSARARRRARREVDRLQRECSRRPLEMAEEPEVTIIGRVHDSPEDLSADPALVPVPAVARPRDTTSVHPVTAPEPDTGAAGTDVAPLGRRERRRVWRRAEKERRAAARHQVRFPILTRSVALWLFIFMVAGLAFGASAAFWWAHFNAEVDGIRAETTEFTGEVAGAADALEAQRIAALDQIDAAMAPLALQAQPEKAPAMAAAAAPSVFFVETLDEEGVASVGSAFVVAATDTQSLLLTSLSTVASSTTAPGPTITLRQGERELTADLWSWDTDSDLALLTVDDPDLVPLEWADEQTASQAVGAGVYAVGGLGGAGATAIPGLVVDQSASGFQHTAVIGAAYRGGPILTTEGKVLGVSSLDYQPLGFDPGDVHFSVPITDACATVLACGSGTTATAGAEGGAPVLDDAPPAASD